MTSARCGFGYSLAMLSPPSSCARRAGRARPSRFLSLVAALGVMACGSQPERQPVSIVFATRPAPDVSAGVAATVRLRMEDGRASYLRSGVIIDPRGYVLTSFSAVGVENISERYRGQGSRPGTLYDGDRVQVEVFDGPYSGSPTTYIARVVRGDMRLNLALLRIVGTLDGALPPDQRFPAVDLSQVADAPRWGSTGLAVGAGANLPSLTVQPATITAGIHNSHDQIAGYLVDLRSVTLDGAPFFDAEGKFAGILSRGFLRPPERVPSAWRETLSSGDIDERLVEGIERLEAGVWSEIDLIGDSPYRPPTSDREFEASENFFYLLPNLQSGTLVTVPAVPIVAYRGGQPIAGGTGEVFVAAEADVLVAVRMPRPNDPRGLNLRVRFEPLQ